MSETWLRSSVPDSMTHLPGYTLFRCDRRGRAGGGVGLYVVDTLQATILKHSDSSGESEPEFIIVEGGLQGSARILLATVYRPPNIGRLQDFFDLFLELQVNYMHAVIMGDFNADMNVVMYDSQQVNSFVSSSSLYLVPYQSTHNLEHSSTLIDLCIADDSTKVKSYGQRDVSFLSAHDLIYITYDIKLQRRANRLVTCRDFRNFNEELFRQDILNIDWSDLFTSNNIDEKIDILNSQLLHHYEKHAPLKSIRYRNLPAPWLTEEIRDAMGARDLARRTWRRCRNDTNYSIYKAKRNTAQNLVRSAKRAHYLEAFNNARSAVSVWSKLRHLGLVKTKANTQRLACPADELNKFFTAMPDGFEVDDIPEENMSGLSGLPGSAFDDRRLFWGHVSAHTIRRALYKAGSNATGSDGISPVLIKTVLPCIMPVLEHLFNFSLMHGLFPESWKTAIVCPIPKIRNPTEVQHYRPISILPALSKALERIVYEQMCCYLSGRDLLNPCQFAYRKHHSTQTCLIRMLDEVRRAADERMVTISVFFDLSKAFECNISLSSTN